MLVIGGFYIGWTIWRLIFAFPLDPWMAQVESSHLLTFITTAWFGAAAVGSATGSIIINRYKKKTVYVSAQSW